MTEQVTIELVRHSVAEEVLVYPQVDKKVSPEEAEHARKEHAEAEETLRAWRSSTPTRPHPNVPNEPLPRMAAGPAASLLDRMRDLATGRGAEG